MSHRSGSAHILTPPLTFNDVTQGIKYFKSGNNVEAFQCLNQALNIDAENVEVLLVIHLPVNIILILPPQGLVARGALFANNGGLEKAVDDFEMALRINPTHR
jgi:tetratricopeptide (TPR) repeat protein